MPYRASLGGEFGGGVQRRPAQGVDFGSAIDALTQGASSLIHGAYLRRQAKDEKERQARQDAQGQANADRDYALKVEDQRQRGEAQRRQDLANGITPAKEGGATATIAPEPTEPVGSFTPPSSSIRDLMTRGMTAPAAPTSALEKPVTEGSLGTLPDVQYGEEAPTPASYDPTKAAAYVRSTETARIQQEAATQRAVAQQAGRRATLELGEQLREKFATFKSTLPGGGGTGTGIRGAMTGNRKEDARKEAAIGLVGASNGSYDEAEAYLNSPEGKDLRELGVEGRHLMFAREKYLTSATSGAIRLQSGSLGLEPAEAVGAVTTTRKLMSGAAPATRRTTTPAAPAAAPGDPSDDEIVAAMRAGAKTPADVRAWVAKQKKGTK